MFFFLTFYYSLSISATLVYCTLSTLQIIPTSITGGEKDPQDTIFVAPLSPACKASREDSCMSYIQKYNVGR